MNESGSTRVADPVEVRALLGEASRLLLKWSRAGVVGYFVLFPHRFRRSRDVVAFFGLRPLDAGIG
jgi:hypothetical protein